MEDGEAPTQTGAADGEEDADMVPDAEDFIHQETSNAETQNVPADNWAENLSATPPTHGGGKKKYAKGDSESYGIGGVAVSPEEFREAVKGRWITPNVPESLALADIIRHNDEHSNRPVTFISAEQAAILMGARPGEDEIDDKAALEIINPLRHGKSAGSVFQTKHSREEHINSAIRNRILVDVSDAFQRKAIDPTEEENSCCYIVEYDKSDERHSPYYGILL